MMSKIEEEDLIKMIFSKLQRDNITIIISTPPQSITYNNS